MGSERIGFGFWSFGIIEGVFIALVVFGYICAYIALTHSIKKRIVWGTDFSAASVFGWTLGWYLLASLWGLPTLIYFLVKRSEINATKEQCAQILRSTQLR
jgi:hypothetical protein